MQRHLARTRYNCTDADTDFIYRRNFLEVRAGVDPSLVDRTFRRQLVQYDRRRLGAKDLNRFA